MTEPVDTSGRGPKFYAVAAFVWVFMGFSAVEDGRMWFAAAGVALGLLHLAMYLWPGSALARSASKPLFGRKKHAEP